MNINLKPILTRLKQELTDLYSDRLQHLTLFGSQARGDAEPGFRYRCVGGAKPPVNPGEEIKRTGKAIADLSLEYDEEFLSLAIQFIGAILRIGGQLQINRLFYLYESDTCSEGSDR